LQAWHGSLASGKTLEVRGINGPIRASGATGQEAEVAGTKRARGRDPAEVEIKVVEHADGVIICAIYPSRRGRQANECRPEGGGQHDTNDNDVEVAFEVRVPAGVEFVGSTVNGDVSGRDPSSDVTLAAVNGDVDAESGGVARGTTVNGSITARLGRADWTNSLRFTTVNGGITVRLPGNVSTDIEATTVGGSVQSDFPIAVQGRMRAGVVKGRIGEGGRLLHLTTVNGSIRVEKGT
jgi:DUF4097 and DUF4098 domain-containing protein YvlB